MDFWVTEITIEANFKLFECRELSSLLEETHTFEFYTS